MSYIKAFFQKKRKLRFCGKLLTIFRGWLVYSVTGKTPAAAYYAMIYAFCYTGGRFNEAVSRIISFFSRKIDFVAAEGVLGSLDKGEMTRLMAEFQDKGYLVFPAALSPAACDRLMKFALDTPAMVMPMDGEASRADVYEKFNADAPSAVRYNYSAQDLINFSEVQELLADETLLAFSQKYLGTMPIVDIVTMWWHTNLHGRPDSNAAQFYHFDMDRIKWLKFFFYLTDVNADDGPHSFIQGSHKMDGIPQKFLRQGYARLSDEDVRSYYGSEREITFVAPKGTIIIEDTRGLHKGHAVAPHGNSRLLLQFEFSNSLFGAAMEKAKLLAVSSEKLSAAMTAQPKTYSAFL